MNYKELIGASVFVLLLFVVIACVVDFNMSASFDQFASISLRNVPVRCLSYFQK